MASTVYSMATHAGAVRTNNEDFVGAVPSIGLFYVVDGHGAGAPAAPILRATVESVLPAALRARITGNHVLDGDDLRDALVETGAELTRAVAADPIAAGTGGTIAALLAPEHDSVAWLAWSGACRAFQLRGDAAVELYTPHLLGHEQVRAGLMTAAEASSSRFRTIVTRVLGYGAPELTHARLDDGAVALVSDGVLAVIDAAELAHIVSAGAVDAATRIIERVRRTAADNVSAVVVARM